MHGQSVPEGNLASWPGRLRAALEAALAAVEARAAVAAPATRSGTTLIVVLAGSPASRRPRSATAPVVIGDGRRQSHVAHGSEQREYINETTFLVSPGAVEGAQHATWDGVGVPAHIAVFSDGLQRLALKSAGKHAARAILPAAVPVREWSDGF